MKDLLKDKGFLRLAVIFLLVTLLSIVLSSTLIENKIDPVVVGFGNLILFLASSLTLVLYGRAKNASTSHGFSRNIYAAFVTKFFILVTAAMLYFYFSGEISVRAVFICLALYFVYHFAGAVHAAKVEKKKVKHHH
jgi:hypothetical protein